MSDNGEARLPPLDPAGYSDAQKAAVADFVATRKSGLTGPWHVFIRSPELLIHAQRMGEYLRYRCGLSGRLSELAILLIAREWTQDYEFGTHRKHAVTAGVSEATVDAIRDGRRPDNLTDDEQIICDFVGELQRGKRVSDATYARAATRFGEQGVVDLSGICGYYTMLAMAMNVARVPPPAGEPHLPRFP